MKRSNPRAQDLALVVDDEPETLSMVSTALEESGMSVIVARDGQTAIDLVERVQPDVILMDALMPQMDGFEACKRLKAPPLSVSAPIIFMTGLTEADDVVRGLKAGGVDYVTKPVVVDELIARLGIHIANSKLLQSARDALDRSGRSILAFTTDGDLSWGSDNALKTVDIDDLNHTKLRQWLATCVQKPLSQLKPLTMNDSELCYVGSSASGELLVKFNRRRSVSNEQLLMSQWSLTLREAEVLYWLTLGKTNRDISTILDLSPRTVNKHLEQIFQKMGVDNRTSAAVAADRMLNGAE